MTARSTAWIEQCWEAHSARRLFGATALNDATFDEAGLSCWCCGAERKLQVCHIVPASLGGSDLASNIVPLCSLCHDEMPDVADPEYFWDWLKGRQNPLSPLGLGRFYDTFMYAKAQIEAAVDQGKFVDCDLYISLLKQYGVFSVSTHFGQGAQGAYIKPATLKWVLSKALKGATAAGQLELPVDSVCHKRPRVPNRR